ncbi:MarR family winged helix-turn-helix transcriptional regulator [Maritimibacter sp. UBA3975]|uniref:MarR family winged helix-turn-helix transcriptional regulator n=1 Tax=Maritimibacter sp. UBA3975 TaxID=1946833 RepID=UPI000C0A033B|nr:MarR family winged helix-turn-helix transcriptional regulator [Maritimibacter sp. UBA3975]MAM62026.1 MarR family transcriptional regulator [Maritimibacter sp.]|tara:strand:+ start:20820 stop:21296 length:477 start_codon:yes stop_codon:yes gene_type:complete
MSAELSEDMTPELAELLTGSCYCLAVRRASRRMVRLYDAALAERGLTISQLAMLAWVKGLRTPTVQKIADCMEMDQSAASRGIRPLEREGLVTSAPHPRDKRKSVLALTEEGVARLTDGAAAWSTAQRQVEAEMSPDTGLAQLFTEINALAQTADDAG